MFGTEALGSRVADLQKFGIGLLPAAVPANRPCALVAQVERRRMGFTETISVVECLISEGFSRCFEPAPGVGGHHVGCSGQQFRHMIAVKAGVGGLEEFLNVRGKQPEPAPVFIVVEP